MPEQSTLVVNGWTIFAHPLFLDEIETLIDKVEEFKSRDSHSYHKTNAAKRLAAIARLAFRDIPENPTLAKYRLESTLGGNHKHWFRAKFFQQYRLFFRFHSGSKVIVFAWVNDGKNKRTPVAPGTGRAGGMTAPTPSFLNDGLRGMTDKARMTKIASNLQRIFVPLTSAGSARSSMEPRAKTDNPIGIAYEHLI